MDNEDIARLRVLVCDGAGVKIDDVTQLVAGLGHEVIPRQSSLADVATVTSAERADVAFVIVHEQSDEALHMIDKIVHGASCPVIAVLDVQDRRFIQEAARRGIFAYITDNGNRQEMQSAIDIVLQRFAQYHSLEGAFGRRAVTERAKGILMERHGIEEQAAFNMLRDQARRSNRKVVEIAEAVVMSRSMLPTQSRE